MPKFKKSNGFRMKGFSYPGTSPLKLQFQKPTKTNDPLHRIMYEALEQGNTLGNVNVTGAQTITDKLNSDISSSTGGTQQQGIDLQVTVNGKPI